MVNSPMALHRKKTKGRSESGRFFALPKSVTDSSSFMKLSGNATKLLLMLFTQYNGKNNGDLSATHSQALKWHISSKDTLSNKLKELRDADLITCTREGRFINPGGQCALYAVTWLSIDECGGKLDVQPTNTPPRVFSIKNKAPDTENGTGAYRKCTEVDQKASNSR